MIEWRDEGVILAVWPHGENAAVTELFTHTHGRHAGIVRGGQGRRLSPVLQSGNQVQAFWHARLASHLGTMTVESLRPRTHLLADRLGLAGLGSVCAVLHAALPEREPHPALWRATIDLLDQMDGPEWPSAYLRWELILLRELGFGLDLATCAVTGTADDLAFVSPKTGRAVSMKGAGIWADRLLPLPAGLNGRDALSPQSLSQGFAITTHFLTRELAALCYGRPLPEARGRLIDLLTRQIS